MLFDIPLNIGEGIIESRVRAPSNFPKPVDIQRYNEDYVKLAVGIGDAVRSLGEYGYRFKDEFNGLGHELGHLNFKFIPPIKPGSKSYPSPKPPKGPFWLILNESDRFYPKELEQSAWNLGATKPVLPSQLDGLITDLEQIKDYTKHMTFSGRVVRYGTNTVGIEYIIKVSEDRPLEHIRLEFDKFGQEDGLVVMTECYLFDQISPKIEIPENSDLYMTNYALAAFDLTESGLYIPIGRNRLSLMKAVLRYLREQIENAERLGLKRTEKTISSKPIQLDLL